MLLGSRSKKREEPLLPLAKLPCVLVSLLKGTPSTINKAWLLPLMELNPRITTLVADPEVPLAEVMSTPVALPARTRATSPPGLFSIDSDATSLTA